WKTHLFGKEHASAIGSTTKIRRVLFENPTLTYALHARSHTHTHTHTDRHIQYITATFNCKSFNCNFAELYTHKKRQQPTAASLFPLQILLGSAWAQPDSRNIFIMGHKSPAIIIINIC